MKKILKHILFFSILFVPLGAFAQLGHPPIILPRAQQLCASGNGLVDLLCNIHRLINYLLPILLAIGVVYFVWGVIRFMIADSEEAKTKGKDQIIYGIIGFTVILGLWGLVNMLVGTFGIQGTAPQLETLTVQGEGSCTLGNNAKLQNLLCYITKIINDSVIPLIFAIATLFFFWGAIKFFIINADEEAQREQGKQFMIWSIIALAVMLSVWGLVGIVGRTFGLNNTSVLPQVEP